MPFIIALKSCFENKLFLSDALPAVAKHVYGICISGIMTAFLLQKTLYRNVAKDIEGGLRQLMKNR
jgi:hypothetical protein